MRGTIGAAMPLRHVLLAVAVAATWGLNFVIIDVGLEEVPPLLLCALRFALVAFPLVFFVDRPPVPWRLLAGIGGASQDGDFRHLLDPRGLAQPGYGYTGIVVAALARYNPFAVVLVAFLLGGLQNAGYTLQSAEFPSGLVGVMQGLILFAMLGGELLVQYRITIVRSGRRAAAPAGAAQ